MAQSRARKSYNLKVVSSSLTGRKSRNNFNCFTSNYKNLQRKKNYKQKVKQTEAFRTEKNVVSLIRNQIFKIIWLSSKRTKRGFKNAKRQRGTLIILGSWVRASQVANQENLFPLHFQRIIRYQKTRKK